MNLKKGDRVKVFDSKLYVNDKSTPPSVTFKPATVLSVHRNVNCDQETLVDVEFDHRLGEISKCHFVWGVRELKVIKQFQNDYRFLSNFYQSTIRLAYQIYQLQQILGIEIYYDDKIYPTAEHLYQALKTEDKIEQEKIRISPSASKAKRLGRRVTLRRDWEAIKETMMLIVIKAKFLQNKELGQQLLKTRDWTLIEGNYWHDNYWGDCFCSKCKNTKGQNHLGQILMKVRNIL